MIMSYASLQQAIWLATMLSAATFLASFLNFLGSIWAGRRTEKMLLLELDHAAAESARNRLAHLQAHIFAQVSQEVTRAVNYIGRHTQPRFAMASDSGRIVEFQSVISLVHLIDDDVISRLANEFVVVCSSVLTQLLEKALRIGEQEQEAERIDAFFERNRQGLQEITAEIAKINRIGNVNTQKQAELLNITRHFQDSMQRHVDVRSELGTRLETARAEYEEFSRQRFGIIGEHQARLVGAMHRALGVPTPGPGAATHAALDRAPVPDDASIA